MGRTNDSAFAARASRDRSNSYEGVFIDALAGKGELRWANMFLGGYSAYR